MFLFDTDHLTILKQQSGPDFDALVERLKNQSGEDLFISIVSFHEQVTGWNKYLAQAKDQAGLTRGYRQLENLLQDYSLAQVMPYDDAAAEQQHPWWSALDTVDYSTSFSAIINALIEFSRSPTLDPPYAMPFSGPHWTRPTLVPWLFRRGH